MAIISDNAYIKRETIFGARTIPAFQTDDFGSIPQIVYKYLDVSLDHHKSSIENQYAWFSDPLTFNDPYDCATNFAFHLLAEDAQACRSFFEPKLKKQYKRVACPIGARPNTTDSDLLHE
jgi:hypothetical protein